MAITLVVTSLASGGVTAARAADVNIPVPRHGIELARATGTDKYTVSLTAKGAATPIKAPLDVVIALDVSYGMNQMAYGSTSKLQAAKTLLKNLSDELLGDTTISGGKYAWDLWVFRALRLVLSLSVEAYI